MQYSTNSTYITAVECTLPTSMPNGFTYSGADTTHLYNTTITLECDTGMYATDSYTQTTDVLCDVNTGDVTTGEWSPEVESISCTGIIAMYI